MIIDLHTHTRPWSDDSNLELPELINRAKQVGLDAICITEHDWFWRQDELEKVTREHDFLVLPGVETNTDDGHFLVYGLDRYIFGMHHTDFLKRTVDEAGGVMILAHPYRRNFHIGEDIGEEVERFCRNPVIHLLDIIETFNGRAAAGENEFSQVLCRQLNLSGVGGSDAHATSDLPAYATQFQNKISNVEELIAELKAGRFRVVNMRSRLPCTDL